MENPSIAILASGDRQSGGGGSTAERVVRDTLEGKVAFGVGVVICNNSRDSVPGLYERFDKINRDFARRGDNRIEVVNISGFTHPGVVIDGGLTDAASAAMCQELEEREIDFASMEGFLKKVTGPLADKWAWHPEYALDERYSLRNGLLHPDAKILNNHPAILPATAGLHGLEAHQYAIYLKDEGKIRHTAMTWHLADPEFDTGPKVDEQPVEIEPGDTAESLAFRVQTVERDLTARVIQAHLTNRAEYLRGRT